MEWADHERPRRRTNSMSIENAKTGNWAVESFIKTGGKIRLRGSSLGYASLDQIFNDGDTVPYTCFDEDGNREAGYARHP